MMMISKWKSFGLAAVLDLLHVWCPYYHPTNKMKALCARNVLRIWYSCSRHFSYRLQIWRVHS